MSNITKHCNKCDSTKEISNFHVNIRSSTGYDSWCKECRNSYNRACRKRWAKLNKVKNKLAGKQVK